ncbi:hypothetical protein EDD21DRAFT_379191 [Dissophora ornata]|nr:hypothetical protein EDD21DRAFT_379191 [Dissophora ornata]
MAGSKVVFVGNIPYEQTEEQLIDIFSEVGPVVSFRLVFERDTGKPRGYGFCEFQDERTAASAVRNLNGRDIGNRLLKVDFADADPARGDGRDLEEGSYIMNIGPGGGGGGGASGGQRVAPHQQPPPMPPQQMPFMQKPPPVRIDPRLAINPSAAGAAIPPHVMGLPGMPGLPLPLSPTPAGPIVGQLSSADAISGVLATMTPQNVYDIIASMKVLAVNEPEKATALLGANPQLSYAIFQALIMMNLIDQNALQRMFPKAAPTSGGLNPVMQPSSQLPPHVPTPPHMTPPLPFPPPVFPGIQQLPQQPNAPLQAPPPVPQPSFEQQQQLLAQVMALSPADIASLPEEQRANIIKLRATLLGNV